MLTEPSIPRNWIVDPHGKWLWEEADFNVDDWPDRVLQRIEGSGRTL